MTAVASRDSRLRLAFKPKPDPRFRTVSEANVIEQLLLVSWAVEVDAGERDAAHSATLSALNRWIRMGLEFVTGAEGGRLFDPVEVINFMKWHGFAGEDPYWDAAFVKTHRAFVGEFPIGRADGAEETLPPARFSVKSRRTFDLQSFAEGASVRLRLPMPLASGYLQNLQTTPMATDDFPNDVVLREQCLEVRFKKPALQSVTIGADFTFTATADAGDAIPLTAHETDLYLRKKEGLVQVTPRVEALAADLGAGAVSTQKKVDAFWIYMIEELFSGMVRYSDVPPEAPQDWVLDNGWYDCQLGAALLVSLCRARGVPARIVSGNLLYRVQPISHYWAEIWFEGEGWKPYDMICWDLSRGGRDKAWRDVFAGRRDYRVATQIFPLAFTGPMSVRFPAAWHMVQVGADGGIDTAYTDAADGALTYRDHIKVEHLGPDPA